jgi:hypothetical protein
MARKRLKSRPGFLKDVWQTEFWRQQDRFQSADPTEKPHRHIGKHALRSWRKRRKMAELNA